MTNWLSWNVTQYHWIIWNIPLTFYARSTNHMSSHMWLCKHALVIKSWRWLYKLPCPDHFSRITLLSSTFALPLPFSTLWSTVVRQCANFYSRFIWPALPLSISLGLRCHYLFRSVTRLHFHLSLLSDSVITNTILLWYCSKQGASSIFHSLPFD